MARKADIDYSKPIYINSYDANEIIYHMLRGTMAKTGNYEASLPVSLDSLKIRELCGKKEMKTIFPSVFHTAGKDESRKTYSDAVINIQFNEQTGLFGDDGLFAIDQVNDDYQLYEKNKEKSKSDFEWKGLSQAYWGKLNEHYKALLKNYEKNREANQEQKGKKLEVEKNLNLVLDENYSLVRIKVSTEKTKIKVSSLVRTENSKADKSTALRFYLTNFDDAQTNQRTLGIYEKNEVVINAKERSVTIRFDIRDIMEKNKEGGYVVNKGIYLLFVETDCGKRLAPIVKIDLTDTINQARRDENENWLDESDWETNEVELDSPEEVKNLPRLSVNPTALITYKECIKQYESIIGEGSKNLLSEKIEELSFSSDKKKDEEIKKNLKEHRAIRVRTLIYQNGIDIMTKDGKKHYRMYKRSAGKAKSGSCLFILDELYDAMFRWSWMGYGFEDNKHYDLTSVKAYEALTLSNIQKVFSLKPENILLIESVEGKEILGNRRIVCKESVTTKAGEEEIRLEIKTTEDCKKCVNAECSKAAVSPRNKIWDGQALLDESVFKEVFTDESGSVEPHGMMLLRNKFFKACAFHTRIQEFYKENHIETVYDMFGRAYDAKNIKLIITPDTLKVLKFTDAFQQTPEKLYKTWKKNMDCFGVVKWDKSGAKEGKYKVGYQVLNTLPLFEEDVEELVLPEKEFIEKLWVNDDLFVEQIPLNSEKGRCVYEMYRSLGQDYTKTKDYINYKTQWISDYKRKLRKGEIYLQGDMYTLCSMPYEMLYYSAYAGKKTEDRKELANRLTVLHKKDEAYIRDLGDGEQIMLCRYPHLSPGSVCILKNKQCLELDKWFRLSHKDGKSNIVVITPWESNIMVKLGGADFDSDTALFVKEPAVLKNVSHFMEKEDSFFAALNEYGPYEDGLPVAQAAANLVGEGISKPYTMYELANLDNVLSNSQKVIGSISNDVQLFDSYLWETLCHGENEVVDEAKAKIIFECIMKLAVLNELEIDRAKHSINLPTTIRKQICDTEYLGKPILQSKEIKIKKIYLGWKGNGTTKTTAQKAYYQPAFLYDVKKDKGNENIALRGRLKKEKYWNCPPDYLAKKVSEIRKPRSANKESLTVYFDKKGRGISTQTNTRQLSELKELLRTTITRLSSMERNRMESDEKFEAKTRTKTEYLDAFCKLKLNESTLISLIRDTLNVKKNKNGCYEPWDKYLYRNRFKVMGLLFEACDYKEKTSKDKKTNTLRRAFDGLYISEEIADEFQMDAELEIEELMDEIS